MKLSARNRLKGKVEDVEEGMVTARLRIRIEGRGHHDGDYQGGDREPDP